MNAKHIASLFGGPRALAEATGAKLETARKWCQRGRIPAGYDLALVDAARSMGLPLSLEGLAAARAPRNRTMRP